jgi:hypothetical protein
METPILAALNQRFGGLADPRVERTKLHKLVDILVIAICAVIAGADAGKMSRPLVRPSGSGSRPFWSCPMDSFA